VRRSDFIRRLFIPALIIIVGLTIAWWSAERKNAEAEAARRFVGELCVDIIQIHESNSHDSLFKAVKKRHGDEFANNTTLEKLTSILIDENARRDNLRVRIRPGDLPEPLGNGDATYIAAIYIDHNPALVLRLQFQSAAGEPKRIIGHVLPEHAL